jgi:hypothetical protein
MLLTCRVLPANPHQCESTVLVKAAGFMDVDLEGLHSAKLDGATPRQEAFQARCVLQKGYARRLSAQLRIESGITLLEFASIQPGIKLGDTAAK